MNVDIEKDDKRVRMETIVVIVSAISVALSRRVRVKRVRYLHGPSDNINIWALQGRINVMSSRKTKR